jgi:hypothetical protein
MHAIGINHGRMPTIFSFFIWARKQIEQTRMLMCHARMQTAKTPQEFLDEEE